MEGESETRKLALAVAVGRGELIYCQQTASGATAAGGGGGDDGKACFPRAKESNAEREGERERF